jgi:hypothetical protein
VTRNKQDAEAVENRATSGITAPREGRHKMTDAGNLNVGQAEKRRNREEGLNGEQLTTKKKQERWQTVGKRARADGDRTSAYALKSIHHALTVITENADSSLVTQGCVGEKPYLMTVDTGAYVTVARPHIAAGLPERQPNQRFTLQTVFGEALPILKDIFLILTLGRRPLKIWVFVAGLTNEFILGLDILRAYDASVDIGQQTLRLAEEVSLWSPGAEPRPSSLIVDEDQVIPALCEGTVMARLEPPRSRIWSGRTEPAGPST